MVSLHLLWASWVFCRVYTRGHNTRPGYCCVDTQVPYVRPPHALLMAHDKIAADVGGLGRHATAVSVLLLLFTLIFLYVSAVSPLRSFREIAGLLLFPCHS